MEQPKNLADSQQEMKDIFLAKSLTVPPKCFKQDG